VRGALAAALLALVAGLSAGAAPADGAKAAPVDVTVAVSGDLLVHAPVWQRAQADAGGHGYDFRPMLRAVRPLIAGADLAVCHVETPMGSGPPHGYPVFRTPVQLARAIRWAGYDACSTASNHSLDGGEAGIAATGKALDHYGVRHTGSATSARGARRVLMLRAKGEKIAYLAYTQVSNGQAQPHWWEVNRASAGRIVDDARRARRAGADAVLVNLHWGDENVVAPSAAQRSLAAALTRSPAITGVVGQHVHVVQPIRRVGSKLVLFGEGNLLSNQTPGCCAPGSQDGIIGLLRLRFTRGHAVLRRIDYVPTYVRHPDFTVLPQHPGSASWNRTVGVIGRTSLYGPWGKGRP
jgi:hypothetical protein